MRREGPEQRNQKGRKGRGVRSKEGKERKGKVLTCFISKASFQMWRILGDLVEKKGITAKARTAEPGEARFHRVQEHPKGI